jgi:predicted dehydrogenase
MKTLSRRNLLLSATAPVLSAQAPVKKIRIAYIGTGHRAWGMIQIIRKMPDVEIVAIADITPENRDRGATLAGPQAKAYSDYKTMLAERKDIDAVVVAVPGALHPEPVITVLGRGLAVLCEKPMAVTIEDANRMIAAADKSGKILQMDQQYRLRRNFTRLHQIVAGGEIGSVKFVTLYLNRGDWNPASWKAPNPKTGKPTVWRFMKSMTGGSMMEDGIHELDIMQWIINAPVDRVYATGGNAVFKDRETLDHAAVIVEYQNGARMQFGFSLLGGSKIREEPVLIVGDKGTIHVDDTKITVRKTPNGDPVVINADEPDAPGMKDNPAMAGQGQANYLSLKSFIENVRTGSKPELDGRVGKLALRIPLLAQKSIDERRIVSAKELPA